MRSAAVRGRLLLILAAAGVAGAVLYPPGESGSSGPPQQPKARPAAALARPSAAPAASPEPEAVPADAIDPFAPRGWRAPPTAQELAPPPPPVSAPVPVALVPVGPPPLPFKFMGQMEDGGRKVVYLSRGEVTLIAQPGVTLDDTYKVSAMDAQRIEFEYLPTGEKQALSIPASE